MAKYDFIVVGGGPAGASLASRLATSGKSPSVLLLEAGGSNNSSNMRIMAERSTTLVAHPDANWSYVTAPQEFLGGRELGYARGKGLGGSSAINFTCWTIGPKDDFDEWARLVGDEAFGWANVRRRYNEIESYDLAVSAPHAKYAEPMAVNHGTSGPVKVEFGPSWETVVTSFVDACEQYGLAVCKDLNSGDPIGIGFPPSTASRSFRCTAASAYLEPPPSNLTIKTHTHVAKVLFEGLKAVGVQTLTGDRFYAIKEVILCAGALDSPKLLLLSGIGPKEQLDRHGISMVQELPGVGENLQDHCLVSLTVQLKDGINESSAFLNDPALLAQAREQFRKDGSGPLRMSSNNIALGFFQNDAVFSRPEFQALPDHIQDHARRPTVPAFEIGALTLLLSPVEDTSRSYLTVAVFGMIPQSRGTVQLASADPASPPLADPNFLSHPFDRRNMIEAVRKILGLLESQPFAKDVEAPLNMPRSASDEDISAYMKDFASTAWHMSSTVRMGRRDDGDAMACVDSDFRVYGVQGLRVADVGVAPFLPNCHTVSIAYLIGNTAAEKIIAEYGLDSQGE